MESALRDEAMASVVFPEGDDFIGDWARGAEVANNGRGLQYSDDPEAPNGGNCYACHQLDPAEVAYGNLGPSLMGYGARGQSEVMLRYTWTKLWNTHAYNVCSHMPRFGALGILTEQQLKDLMAYLFDPDSPVNQSIE
jgi:sulfur-oxidizing protein SoxX